MPSNLLDFIRDELAKEHDITFSYDHFNNSIVIELRKGDLTFCHRIEMRDIKSLDPGTVEKVFLYVLQMLMHKIEDWGI